MTNNETPQNTTPEEVVTYKAVFTLSQEGIDGDFISSLRLTPEPNPDEPALVHALMAAIVNQFHVNVGVMDDNGNLLVEPTDDPNVVRAVGDVTKH